LSGSVRSTAPSLFWYWLATCSIFRCLAKRFVKRFYEMSREISWNSRSFSLFGCITKEQKTVSSKPYLHATHPFPRHNHSASLLLGVVPMYCWLSKRKTRTTCKTIQLTWLPLPRPFYSVLSLLLYLALSLSFV
jgi:hypothetical protein